MLFRSARNRDRRLRCSIQTPQMNDIRSDPQRDIRWRVHLGALDPLIAHQRAIGTLVGDLEATLRRLDHDVATTDFR